METKSTGSKNTFSYLVKVDFSGPENLDAYNLHTHFAKLIQEMLRVDRDIIVDTTKEGKVWTNHRELPIGNNFTEAFNVTQGTRNDKPRIIMYTEIKTEKWKYFKGDDGIFCYLCQNNIFIQIDQFDAEETGFIGYVLEIHPTLTRKEELVKEYQTGLAEVKATDDWEVEEWKSKNPSPLEESNDLLPKFNMFTWNYKLGDASNRMEAIILAIRAKQKDTVYMKCLMAAGYEQGIFDRGVFVSNGIHIKEGPNFLKNLL
eukprot:1098631-Ditylum_brightwellii.AAC.1